LSDTAKQNKISEIGSKDLTNKNSNINEVNETAKDNSKITSEVTNLCSFKPLRLNQTPCIKEATIFYGSNGYCKQHSSTVQAQKAKQDDQLQKHYKEMEIPTSSNKKIPSKSPQFSEKKSEIKNSKTKKEILETGEDDIEEENQNNDEQINKNTKKKESNLSFESEPVKKKKQYVKIIGEGMKIRTQVLYLILEQNAHMEYNLLQEKLYL